MILLVGSLSGFTFKEALQSDEPLYKCVDEEKIRNCVNGVKADGKRCYYNKTNPYDYDYCSSNWTKIDKQKLLEELYGDEQENRSIVPRNRSSKGTVKCYENKCVKVG